MVVCLFFIDYFIRGVRDDIEQEDEIESYLRFMEENPHLGLPGDDEEEVYEYDADGNIIGTEKKVNNSGFFFLVSVTTITVFSIFSRF